MNMPKTSELNKTKTRITASAVLISAILTASGCSTSAENSQSPICNEKTQLANIPSLEHLSAFTREAKKMTPKQIQESTGESFIIFFEASDKIIEKYGNDAKIDIEGGQINQKVEYQGEALKRELTVTAIDRQNPKGCISYKYTVIPERGIEYTDMSGENHQIFLNGLEFVKADNSAVAAEDLALFSTMTANTIYELINTQAIILDTPGTDNI